MGKTTLGYTDEKIKIKAEKRHLRKLYGKNKKPELV